MKKAFIVIALIFVAAAAFAEQVMDDVKQSPNCKYCGMDREKFSHSRMYIQYEDGTATGTCSLHCAAVELANSIDKTPKSIQVGDFNTKKLIDAEKAFWVVGGGKQGVMTKQAKWAFENKTDAEAFMKETGGSPASFDEAIRLAYDDMYQDTKMIRERRAMMKKKAAMPMEHHH